MSRQLTSVASHMMNLKWWIVLYSRGPALAKSTDKNLESTGTAFIKDLPSPMIRSEPEEDDIIGTITVMTDPSLQKLNNEESPTGGE